MIMYRLFVRLVIVILVLSWGVGQCWAQDEEQTDQQMMYQETHKSANQRRQEARERLQEIQGQNKSPQIEEESPMAPSVQPPIGINPAVDINLPNFANSPNLRKFINRLPGLAINPAPGDPSVNEIGQYIPVAVPDTIKYPGCDYYEIGLVEYREQMHSDLPPVVGNKTDPNATGGTKLRGYVQLNGGDPTPHYLGPIIVAKRGYPVRIKFVNMLPKGAGGNLFLPVDTTIMGSGMFHTMDAAGNMIMGNFTQNRGTLHLHGGLTPWISDGTPHQWITPAGETTPYPTGVSVVDVPDMPDPGPGSMTFYYTNEQSARLMFYHDHSYGITRLNVYAGEAAGYLVTDQVEEGLITSGVLPDLGGLYHNGIPLVIQDKSFVNDAGTPPPANFPTNYTPTPNTMAVDPLWFTHVVGSKGGDLWFPHEYLPNENIYDDVQGYNDMGRWDYGPWILPPMLVMNNTLPSPSHVPEAFMDTMVVNGTAFPYVELPPTPVRFRILNACNDRFLNLQMYKADAAGYAVTDTTGKAWATEVKMVPAAPNSAYPTWPKDGRDGGVPDPTTAGPSIIQIGNECGFLVKPAVIPPQPVDFDYNRRSVTFGGLTSKSLLLPPAVRADVIVDLSQYADGDTLIFYNDAPAPVPLYDTRYDYFTDSPDLSAIGGAPTTPPGFGPNTRTVMQIRIKGTATAAYNLAALQTALPKAFAAGQDPIIMPASAYNAAYGTNYRDVYANVADYTLNPTGVQQSVAKIVTDLFGFGYVTPPTVSIYGGGGGTGATAVATLNGITGIVLTAGGSGYTSPPVVTITGVGTGATAQATVSGGVVTAISITDPGSNYTTAPLITLTGGGGTGATAIATVTLGSVGSIVITNPGSGYTKAPYVYLTGGGGTGAAAAATLPGDMVMYGKNLVEGMDMEFGRMNAVLGSTPNPLAPTVGAGPVIGAAFYMDPPTEILTPDQPLLWRISHVGVDSHSLHFHLFEVQVINRVDWTNTLKPPYDDEYGWKETIRTNPFEDIIVALRPKASAMKLPFGLPDSVRLLDPTMPINSIGNFQPVPPPIGVPNVAQITNVMTNFGWEYVWHCHLLGHEENDMMRPIVFDVPRALPTAPVLSGTGNTGKSILTWTDGTPVNAPTTPGNPANEIGYRIERATGTGAFAPLTTALANATTHTDLTAVIGRTYRYRVTAYNAAGNSTSNIVTVTPRITITAPSNLSGTVSTVDGAVVTLKWTDRSDNEEGFVIYGAIGSGSGLTWFEVIRVGPNVTTYVDPDLPQTSGTYSYRVRAFAGNVYSSYSNTIALYSSGGKPAAPTQLTVTGATSSSISLAWTDNSAKETGFQIYRSTDGTNWSRIATIAANSTTYTSTGLTRGRTYWYRVRSYNAAGTSAWTNTVSARTP